MQIARVKWFNYISTRARVHKIKVINYNKTFIFPKSYIFENNFLPVFSIQI